MSVSTKIKVYSPAINRREMDAVLTCLVDEEVGPGSTLLRLISFLKEDFGCLAAAAFRTPAGALKEIFNIMGVSKEVPVMISALAPKWQLEALTDIGQSFFILDVDENKGVIDPMAAQHGVNNGGKVIIASNAFGVKSDIEKLLETGATVIEDVTGYYKASDGSRFAIFTSEDGDAVTSGGGAVIFTSAKQEATVLTNRVADFERTKLLPDVNSALLMVQLKERKKWEELRKALYTQFLQATLPTKNRALPHAEGDAFPAFVLRLKSSFSEVEKFAQNYAVEVLKAFCESVIATMDAKEQQKYPCAQALLKSVARFPLHARLKKSDIETIAKVLRTLP